MDDRTKLLQSLSIDRSPAAAAPRRRLWPVLVGGVAAGLAAAAAVWTVVPHEGAPSAPRVAAETSAPPTPAPPTGPPTAQPTTGPAPATVGQAPATAPAARPRAAGLAASGYVVARRKATVAAEITGKVTETLVEEGMVVEAGQPVARIDSTLAATDLALAAARVEAADAAVTAISADLRDAERILERTRSLSQKSFATEADLTRTEARVHVLRAQLAQAKAQKAAATLDARRAGEVLEKHTIKAPFGGVVVDRSAQPGEMISPMSAGGSFTRTGICTIVDMESLEVEVDVNEAFIGRVHKGGPVQAVLDAYPDWIIPAYVIAIVPTANREKATVKVRIGFRAKDPRILPDMAVKVTFLDDTAANGGSGGPAGAATAPERAAAAR
ncbi:efflux RND transporter periplasmic adaptor subunit [Rhodoplanes azumiensis]|uniref:Efflux RND transporter periplasmic adaptor subunit n=1 Tax=Rhodoplanes azumiensis TaxID=1897628 RepID=A0ABW5AR33_9BRAD